MTVGQLALNGAGEAAYDDKANHSLLDTLDHLAVVLPFNRNIRIEFLQSLPALQIQRRLTAKLLSWVVCVMKINRVAVVRLPVEPTRPNG